MLAPSSGGPLNSRSSLNSTQSATAAYLNIECGDSRRQYKLTEHVTTIGRSKDNVLEIPDKNMSRRHTLIERREDGAFILTDCNSSNGTVVNGERTATCELEDGDWIEVGTTRLQFINPSRASRRSRPRMGVEDDGQKTAELGVILGQREDLRKLLAINKELNREHELRPLLERIIDAAIDLMAGERGFLILYDRGEMKIEIARGLPREAGKPVVSKRICNEVIEKGKAILTTNAVDHQDYGRYQSVVGLGLHSVLCVPFKIKDTVLGVLYLDNDRVGAFSEQDVELLEAFSDQAAVAIDNARLIRAMKHKERLEQEMRTAAEIQAKLLPRRVPAVSGITLSGRMTPAKEIGGDYYDFVELPGGDLLICIGDVSGKGVPAGLIMAAARSMIRSLAPRVPSTRELVIDLNRLLADDLDLDMFMSLLLIRYQAKEGRFLYTGAGHEHLIIYRAADQKCEALMAGGVVLGVVDDIEEHLEENEILLAPGDGLILYTDGVTEAFDSHRRQYDLERLIPSCERHGHQLPERILELIVQDLLDFVGPTPQSDDITLVTIKKD